ncbi:MAG: S9 family peptidase, partial [Bacteroidales bacterium]|nr:S9 family peptidase [Bacteroidales bacterium]
MNLKTVGALLAAWTVAAGCASEMKQQKGYIGPSEIRIEDGIMTPEALLSFGRLGDPQLSPDGKTVLYGVSYTSIPENRSVRNLFVTPAEGGEKTQLTFEGKSVSNARWAPDGKAVYFLQGGQLYKASFAANKLGKKVKISDVPAGINEFSLSPDGQQVLYASGVHSAVERPVDTDPALDKANAYATEDLMYRHWDHWVETIDHSFVAALANGPVTPERSLDILGGPEVLFQLPNGPFGGIEQLCWSPDGRYIAYSCKKKTGREYAFSTDTDIFIYCILTGETTQVTSGGGYDTDPAWSPDGSRLAWLSMARDGYEADQTRLKVADLAFEAEGEGQTGNPAVAAVRTLDFPFNAAGPVWNPDGSILYFNALYDKAVQGIYQTDPSLSEAKLLTREGDWHDYNSPFGFLADGTVLASYCSMDFPTELISIRPSDRKFLQLTHENEAILRQLRQHRTELRTVKTVDGKDMPTWVLYPPEFDSTKVYPAIEITLGGPQGTLSQGWSYRWNYLLMAHQGYIVVLPNRRGTTAFGQPWCEQISGDYIGLNMQDYLSAAKMVKAEPYVGKLAACGASYGGYSVYYLAGIHGDVYDCFIAHAGIFNEEHMYMTTEEMWFPNWDNGGLHEYAFTPGETGARGDGETFGGIRQGGSPWSSAPKAVRHYANSPHTLVKNWHTPILCIHCGSDFLVPYDEGMAAFNDAQMMGVPSKLIVFPNE